MQDATVDDLGIHVKISSTLYTLHRNQLNNYIVCPSLNTNKHLQWERRTSPSQELGTQKAETVTSRHTPLLISDVRESGDLEETYSTKARGASRLVSRSTSTSTRSSHGESGLLLRSTTRAIALVLVGPTALVRLTLEVVETSSGNAIERIHVRVAGAGVLTLLSRTASYTTSRWTGETRGGEEIMTGVVEVNIGWDFGVFACGFLKTIVQTHRILAECDVLGNEGLQLFTDRLDALDFLLEFADICLLALTEGPLPRVNNIQHTYIQVVGHT